MGKLYEFKGGVTEIRLSANLEGCRCAEITVQSTHCQIMRSGGSSSPYFMTTERKFMMPVESVKSFRLGQKLTITLSSDE